MFKSEHAHLIWDTLYDCYIPEIVTQNTEYLRKFGVRLTGDKTVDIHASKNLTQVKIPIISIMEYFDQGIPVQILKREDMLSMNRDITLYLDEWKNAMKFDINVTAPPRDLLTTLDKFCKHIYGKATAKEVIGNKIDTMRFGLKPRLDVRPVSETAPIKPDYEGISKLVRQKTRF